MAMYKIPQDVEADDKFVGPLSFKQFIFSGIAAICAYLSFLSLTKGFWPALIIFLPVIVVFGFLGFPWGRDQPTEVWLAARIRFFLKPRKRIWNQSGIKDLVTITVPKRVERHMTDGLSQTEVKSRLRGLADLLDSRGWAVKNVNVNLYTNPMVSNTVGDYEDRLVDVTTLPQEVVDVTATDDVFNESTNPTAQHFNQLVHDAEAKRRQDVLAQLETARAATDGAAAIAAAETAAKTTEPKADFWFLQQGAHGQHQSASDIMQAISTPKFPEQPAMPEPSYTTFQNSSVVAPHSTTPAPLPTTYEETAAVQQPMSPQDEQALLNKIHQEQSSAHLGYGHIKTIQPLGQGDPQAQQMPQAQQAQQMQPATQTPVPAPQPVTPPVNPAIINLAHNDDFNVETLARQAKQQEQRLSDDEVVVSLR